MHLSRLLFILPVIFIYTACQNNDQKNTDKKSDVTASDSIAVKLQLVTKAVNAPVELDVAPDSSNRLFITDLSGKIWIWKNDSLLPKPFIDISTRLEKKDISLSTRSQYSMAFHPQFATNGKFYICYNAPTKIAGNTCKLVVSEFTAAKGYPDSADANSERRVFEMEGKVVQEFAGQIVFGPDGYLYISIGDHGDSGYVNHAQDMNSFCGKMLRIDVDKTPYAIPPDNPFKDVKGDKPEIWASGFRRLWRFSFDPKTKDLFAGDVGEAKQEEVDLVQKGGNYGWPVREGDSAGSAKNPGNITYAPPVNTYTHKEGICIIGGNFYYGAEIPLLENKYVFADLNGNVFALNKNDSGTWLRQPLKIVNKPSDPFVIFSCGTNKNADIYLLGALNTDKGYKGIIYKLAKG